MPNYQNGKVYVIRTHKSDDFYIGSTTIPLSKRLCQHKQDYKRFKKGKRNYITSFKIIENEDAYIELLEECPFDNKMLLDKREGELIRANKCVNKCIPGRTQKEYNEDNKDEILKQKKEYYEINKVKISKQSKEYYLDNKDKKKQYAEKNKDKISERMKGYSKEYRKTNKDILSEKAKKHIECDCGSV